MRKQISIASIGLATLALMGLVEAANACSCGREPLPCVAFSGASAVFVGKVLDAEQQKEAKNEDGIKSVYDVGAIRFEVVESFSGPIGERVVIRSGTGGGDCGYWFKRGEMYLVYAFGKAEQFSTSICTRTRLVREAEEDLAFLRTLPKRGSGGTLYGVVNQYAGDMEHGPFESKGPMAGIKVTIQGLGARHELFTDNHGQYRINGLAPGDYDVRLELPPNLASTSSGDTVDRFGSYSGHKKTKVFDRGCTENSFTVQSNGRISGRITDAEGKPAKEMKVDLVKADDPEKGWAAWTDANGKYEFRMVQPGRYFLGINLEWAPDDKYPYPRMYYPAVAEETSAKVLLVGDGEKLVDLDLALPPRLVERSVSGVVTWLDARPAAGARVFFELRDDPGKSMPKHAVVDAEGQFSLRLFRGHAYVIYANIESSSSNYVHSEAIELSPTEKTGPIQLILTQPGSGFGNSRIMRKRKN
jgi:hypothetical protein